MDAVALPTQIEIGFDQFKTALFKGGASLLANLAYFTSARFATEDWELTADFLVSPTDKLLIGKKRPDIQHPWCVVMTIHEKGKSDFERVCDFPETATVKQTKQFCFRILQTAVIDRLEERVDRARLFQKILAEFS